MSPQSGLSSYGKLLGNHRQNCLVHYMKPVGRLVNNMRVGQAKFASLVQSLNHTQRYDSQQPERA